MPSARQAAIEDLVSLNGTPSLIDRLRDVVRSLAVQGRLVPQIAEEEAASHLLARVVSQKEAGDAMRGRSRGAARENAEQQALPSSWAWATLDELCTDVVDCPHSTPKFVSRGFLCLDTNSFKDGRLLPQKLRFVEQSTFNARIERLRPAPGDLVFAREGSVGESVIIPEGTVACLGQRVMLFRFSSQVLNEFYRLTIGSPAFIARLLEMHKGIGAKHVNVGDMRQALVPVPPMAEQRRIVARVEELMKLCDALEANGRLADEQHARLTSTLFDALAASESAHALAENWQRVAECFDLLLNRPEAVDSLEQAVLQLAVRGALVPQLPSDESASELLERIAAYRDGASAHSRRTTESIRPDEADCPFTVPSGWAWTTWEEVAQQIGDIDHKMPREVADGVPYISPRDFTEGNGIDFAGAKKITVADYEDLALKIRPERGDLIYPRYGTIGKVRVVETDLAFLASYSCAVIKCMNGFVDPQYQFIVSISKSIVDQAAVATNKTTQPNVGLKSIKAFLFPLPPLAEQHRIVTRVNELRRLCADLRARLTQARQVQSKLADALVDAALT